MTQWMIAVSSVFDTFWRYIEIVGPFAVFVRFASLTQAATDFTLLTSANLPKYMIEGIAAGQLAEAKGYGPVFLSAVCGPRLWAGLRCFCCPPACAPSLLLPLRRLLDDLGPPFVITSTIARVTVTPLLAQEHEEPVEMGEIVIQMARIGATESSIRGAVQVVGSEQIIELVRRGQALSRALPDLAPANCTIGGASQTLRGRTTQILIDGVARGSELRGFDRELSVRNPNSIERIEIVKGSTARFGNGSTGGIINIVTKRPAEERRTTVETRLSGQSEGGSLGNKLFLSHDTRAGDLGLRFELSRSDTGTSFDGDGNRIPADRAGPCQ